VYNTETKAFAWYVQNKEKVIKKPFIEYIERNFK